MYILSGVEQTGLVSSVCTHPRKHATLPILNLPRLLRIHKTIDAHPGFQAAG